jgi:hypothetical protein
MNTNRALTKVDPKQFQALDAIAENASLALETAQGFIRAHTMATAIQDLKVNIEPMMDAFMPLQNTSLGFKTDNAAGYDRDTVRDALIEATLRGVQPVGNQFNIIQKRCYITREGYQHRLRTMKGLSDLKVDMGVPEMKTTGATVACSATWTYKDKADGKKAEIPVRVNSGMGADAVLGKAERKFLKRIFEQITGCPEADDAVEEGGVDRVVKPANVTAVETPNFGNVEKGTLNV